ncbi:MAG: lysine biosynthesis protein LysX [Egibacteraceae bacterium]
MFAVAASRLRFEEKRILDTLARRKVSHTHLDPRRIWVELGAGAREYTAVLNREIAQTRGWYLAHLLEAAGISVVNSARASQTCADKVMCTTALRRHGLPVPRTAVALDTAGARDAVAALGYPVVIKPVVGSWGRLLGLLHDGDAVDAVLNHRDALPSPQHRVLYLQELIDKPGRDIRVIVIGGEAVGAIYRGAQDWRTNTARGASATPCALGPDLAELAVRAAAAVGADIAGVDLVEDRLGGCYVLEVNHTVEFRGFQAAHGDRIDVAAAIVDHLQERWP